MIDMRISMKGDMQAVKELGAFPLQIRRALEYSQKEALKAMRNTAIDFLTDYYYIKASKVRQSINTRKYSKGGMFIVRGTRLPIHNYKLTPAKRKKKPQQLFGAVRKDGGLKSLGKAFLIPTKTGKQIAMVRRGRARLPIEPVISPAIPQLLEKNPKIQEEMIAAGKAVMVSAFNQKIQGLMKSGQGKSSDLSRYSSSYNPMDERL